MTTQATFSLLQDIARDLSADTVCFPTFLDITFQVRNALKNQRLTREQLAKLVGAEPLMSTKIIRLANSVAINPSGKRVVDLNSAIARVGTETVRAVSFAVAMEQLLNSKNMAPFEPLSRRLWEHTMHVAALSRVLARRLTCVNPDEAMFAGLVHDIGVFYLLARAASFPRLVGDLAELTELLVQWHDSIGHALLSAMDLPEEVLLAVQEHEQEQALTAVQTLADVVYVANKIENLSAGWRDTRFVQAVDTSILTHLFQADALRKLLAESAADVASLKSALAG